MTAKILAGLVAAVALTGVGIYAATGSVPGAETISSALTSDGGCPLSGGCGAKSACSEAATCPLSDTESVSTAVAPTCPVDGLGAMTGGMTAGVAPTKSKKSCCSEE